MLSIKVYLFDVLFVFFVSISRAYHILTLLYFTLLYFTLLYFTLLYFTLLYFTLLYFTLLYFTLLYFTLLYFTLLYFTLLYFTLLYFTLIGVVSSDVSRSSCTTSFTPWRSIFNQSHFFFQACLCRLLDVIDSYCILGRPFFFSPASFRECMSLLDYIYCSCMHVQRKPFFLLIIWARSSRLVWS